MTTLDLCNDAKQWYDLNHTGRQYHNWYHNWDHAKKVVDAVRLITETPSDGLLLAAYWHDAVYVPGAGSDANERCSAAALGQWAKQYLVNEETVVFAQQLIRFTSIEYHFNPNRITGDMGVLLDADLSSLADPYDTFVQHQKNIIAEMGRTWPESQKESAEFLEQFLQCRPSIYHTEYGRDTWELKARDNIKRYTKG